MLRGIGAPIVLGALLMLNFSVVLTSCAPSRRLHAPQRPQGGITERGGGRSWTGLASYYGEEFHNRRTANGEAFDMYAMTAAHKNLPFNTVVQVTNLINGRSVRVRINDRGPFAPGREIDLSYAAARELDMVQAGVVKVRIEIIKLGEG